ncbi:hypothetical protein [Equine parapoxvirus]|nr:hypothetical protein [Equine parapoxvirus]
MMDEELVWLMRLAMDADINLSQMARLRQRLTKLQFCTSLLHLYLCEAMMRKRWLPTGRVFGTDVHEDIRLLEHIANEAENARDNIEPHMVVMQWVSNSDLFDECLSAVMDAAFGDAVFRLAMGVVEAPYPHQVAERCYSLLSVLFSENVCAKFTNAVLRQARTVAGCVVERAGASGSYDELVDMVRNRRAGKMRLWSRVVDYVVQGVLEQDLDGLKAYARACLMGSRACAGGLMEIIQDQMAPVIKECILESVAAKNVEHALSLYVAFNATIKASEDHAGVVESFSGKTLYAAVMASCPGGMDVLLAYIGRLPRDELNAFVRVAVARIVKSLYTETNVNKHLALKHAMDLHPQMLSSSLGALTRKYMAGTLRVPMVPACVPDGGPDVALVPVNAYTAPCQVPSAELRAPPSLADHLGLALDRADTAYTVTPLAAFGRAELTLTTSCGELDIVCSSAHLVCIVLMSEAGRRGVAVEDAAAHLGGDARLAEMSLLRLCREKIARKRTVDGARRFVVNAKREVGDSPLSIFN